MNLCKKLTTKHIIVAFQIPKTAPANILNKIAPGMHQICK